jgi:hypothetical protein
LFAVSYLFHFSFRSFLGFHCLVSGRCRHFHG